MGLRPKGSFGAARGVRLALITLSMAIVWSALAANVSAATTPPTSRFSISPLPPEGSPPLHPAVPHARTRPAASTPPPPGNPITSTTAVTGISASLPLIPLFTTSIHDYVIRCSAGINSVTFTVQAPPSADQTPTIALAENQAQVVSDPTTQYWVRCLPHDFPKLTVAKPGTPTPGYYLTSNITSPSGQGSYVMILDTNGTPVWYSLFATPQVNVSLVPNTHTLAFGSLTGVYTGTDPYGAYQLYNLDTQTLTLASPAIAPMDAHEFLPLSNGNRVMLASPLRNVPNTDPLPPDPKPGNPPVHTIIDCIVQEVDPNGQLVWSWDAYDHMAPAENQIGVVSNYLGQRVADVYHCNSVDVDPITGDRLISLRSDNAVVRVSRANGQILWKLGGVGAAKDGGPLLTVAPADDEGSFSGQHDARFLPTAGHISLYDDHTFQVGAARGMEFSIAGSTTASIVQQFKAADLASAVATGSFRRYADGHSVVGWGFKGGPTFSEVDAAGVDQLDVTFNGTTPAANPFSYRVLKVPPTTLPIDLLRRTAGAQPFSPRSGTVLDGWGGLHNYGPDQVNTAGFAYWYGWDIARGVVTKTDGSGGYTLDGWGGIHAFGNAPPVVDGSHAYWPGWDIARAIALCPNGTSGYTADGWGGVHGFGSPAPPNIADGDGHAYFPGTDIVRGIVVTPDCAGGYTLDGHGGVNAFGTAGIVTDAPSWPGWDIARSIVLRPDGHSGYVLDGWGGVHGFGGIPSPPISGYWNGWDIARSLTLGGDSQSGYVVDGWGGLHPFGAAAPPPPGTAYWQYWDIARGTSGS